MKEFAGFIFANINQIRKIKFRKNKSRKIWSSIN